MGALKKSLRLALLASALVCASFLAQGQVSVRDDAGKTLTLKASAQRVITLAPSLTELLFVAGGGQRLVGTVNYSNYPAAAQSAPKVGDGIGLDVEAILELKPDLILAWQSGNSEHQLRPIRQLGIPVFYLETRRVSEIPSALRRLGALVGSSKEAQQQASQYQARYDALKDKYAKSAKVRVFYQIDTHPLMTINNEHIISDVLALCGGENVFGREKMLVPLLSTESVVSADPQAILSARLDLQGGVPHALRNPKDPAFVRWQAFGQMQAVRRQQFWTIPADLISRNGPRILDGTQAVCEALDGARGL